MQIPAFIGSWPSLRPIGNLKRGGRSRSLPIYVLCVKGCYYIYAHARGCVDGMLAAFSVAEGVGG